MLEELAEDEQLDERKQDYPDPVGRNAEDRRSVRSPRKYDSQKKAPIIRSPTENERFIGRLGSDAPTCVLQEDVIECRLQDPQAHDVHALTVAIEAAHHLGYRTAGIADGRVGFEKSITQPRARFDSC